MIGTWQQNPVKKISVKLVGQLKKGKKKQMELLKRKNAKITSYFSAPQIANYESKHSNKKNV